MLGDVKTIWRFQSKTKDGWVLLCLVFYGTWDEAVTECSQLRRLGRKVRPARQTLLAREEET